MSMFGGEGTSGSPARQPTHPQSGEPNLAELLRAWRAAERGLGEVEPGTAAWRRLQDEVERLRQRYQEAFASHSHSDPTGSSA
jgi:hypothetical protein